MAVSDHQPSIEGALAFHADTGGRHRRSRVAPAGLDDLGERKPAGEDPFEPFVDYVRERLKEDPHLWAVTLFDEVTGLGYDRSYPTFTRQIRVRSLRPHCEPCRATNGRANAPIAHPRGEETGIHRP